MCHHYITFFRLYPGSNFHIVNYNGITLSFYYAVKLDSFWCSSCFIVLFQECHSSVGHPGLVISIYSIFLDRNLPINCTHLPADVWRMSLGSVKINGHRCVRVRHIELFALRKTILWYSLVCMQMFCGNFVLYTLFFKAKKIYKRYILVLA